MHMATIEKPLAATKPTQRAAGPQAGDGDDPTADTAQIRALRIAVIVMSLLLVIGFITVIARIIYLASKPAAQPASAVTAPSHTGPATLMPDIALPLPPGAAIAGTAMDGVRLSVHYTTPGGGGIVVLDLETGRVLSRVRLTAEPPR